MTGAPAISNESPSPLDNDPRLQLIVDTLQDKKALDILLIDLREVSDAADTFVICTGTSEPHVRALSNDVVDALREAGHKPWHVEGRESLRWVLVDLVDVVIHIFRQEARDFYALERLWGDADKHTIENGADADPSAYDFTPASTSSVVDDG